MTEQMTLEAAQAATVQAIRAKNAVLIDQKASRAKAKANQAGEIKIFNKTIADCLAREMVIRRAQAKAEAQAAASKE